MSEDNQQNVLEITPSNELRFKGPFTSVVTSHLMLRNPGPRPLCYKVKTTAPRMYCVRPNSGIIEPNKQVDISVMLQPFEYSHDNQLRHKFLIQSTQFVEQQTDNFEQLWRSVNKEDITEIKLRCVFEAEMSSGDNSTVKIENNNVQNLSNSAGLASNVDEMKRQLDELKAENTKLRENESRLRKIALQDTLDNTNLPTMIEQNKQSHGSNMMLLMILCLLSFIIGIIIAKFSL